MSMMAQMLNKYGRTVLDGKDRREVIDNVNREGKRCVMYTRVSTEMQVDGYSLEGQITRMTNYAEREGMTIVNKYEDAGKSASRSRVGPRFRICLTISKAASK